MQFFGAIGTMISEAKKRGYVGILGDSLAYIDAGAATWLFSHIGIVWVATHGRFDDELREMLENACVPIAEYYEGVDTAEDLLSLWDKDRLRWMMRTPDGDFVPLVLVGIKRRNDLRQRWSEHENWYVVAPRGSEEAC
jgi:hypothetical protein